MAQPSYFAAFAKSVATRPVEQWKPFLKFHAIDRFAPYLSAALVNARFDFRGRTLQGIQELQPRWRRALTNLDSAVGELLGKLYVDTHFTPAAKARMDTLVENLRGAYRQGIDGLEWMSPETKKEAHAKLAAFRPKIGYPTKWRDYSAVEIRKDDLVGNMTRALSADAAYQLGKVGKPVDPEEWSITPQTVNAYYNPVRNEIVFPAAILQPPFFDMAADDAVNYGGYRRRDRPRNGPRLRRPGPALRRQGRVARLVDGARTRRSSCAAPRAWSPTTAPRTRCRG